MIFLCLEKNRSKESELLLAPKKAIIMRSKRMKSENRKLERLKLKNSKSKGFQGYPGSTKNIQIMKNLEKQDRGAAKSSQQQPKVSLSEAKTGHLVFTGLL